MGISAETIKELREMTSCGVIECKKALEEAKGDIGKAKEILKKRGLEIAVKKGSREAKEGRIEAYIHHGNKIGVLVELNCETDFVAKNDEFGKLAREIAMQIAAANPKYIKREDVPEMVLKGHKNSEEFIQETCLYEQAYIKDPGKTVKELITSLVAAIGENIFVGRFVRFKVSEVE
ncbi:MAG TPA: elongation factor Ts [Candidatus Omnitrophota bacterium]|nr:elongation factor Ts [Candidatus Omnitrophota bacterium]